MRIFKPAYTKPLPGGSKVLKRKSGRWVRFIRNKRGEIVEGRLTKKGDRVLVETELYHISFFDNGQIKRDLEGFTDAAATAMLGEKVKTLLHCQANRQTPDLDLQKWMENMPLQIRDQLVEFGLIDLKRSAAGKTLAELIAEFGQSLAAKEVTQGYISETLQQLKRLFDGVKYFSDISAATVETYLKQRRQKGMSFRRSNGYLMAAKMFCNWMIDTDYAHESPLRHLKGLNTELDRRRERRAATPDELRRLIEVTKSSGESFGMTGYERSLLYRFTAETGLRANEIRTLKISAFDFGTQTVTVETCYSKHRKEDRLPLRHELAEELKGFTANKLPTTKVFGGSYKALTDRTSEILRDDLSLAGISYIDEAGRVFDFHALRHTFITNLSKAPSRVAQALARHRSSAMTDKYTHARLIDERAALENLPDLSLPKAKKTGTE